MTQEKKSIFVQSEAGGIMTRNHYTKSDSAEQIEACLHCRFKECNDCISRNGRRKPKKEKNNLPKAEVPTVKKEKLPPLRERIPDDFSMVVNSGLTNMQLQYHYAVGKTIIYEWKKKAGLLKKKSG